MEKETQENREETGNLGTPDPGVEDRQESREVLAAHIKQTDLYYKETREDFTSDQPGRRSSRFKALQLGVKSQEPRHSQVRELVSASSEDLHNVGVRFQAGPYTDRVDQLSGLLHGLTEHVKEEVKKGNDLSKSSFDDKLGHAIADAEARLSALGLKSKRSVEKAEGILGSLRSITNVDSSARENLRSALSGVTVGLVYIFLRNLIKNHFSEEPSPF